MHFHHQISRWCGTRTTYQSLGFTQLVGKQLHLGRCVLSWMSPWERFLKARFKINIAIKTLCQLSLLCNTFKSNIQPNTTTKKPTIQRLHERKKLLKSKKSMSQPDFCHRKPVFLVSLFWEEELLFSSCEVQSQLQFLREICSPPSQKMILLASLLAHSQPGGKKNRVMGS